MPRFPSARSCHKTAQSRPLGLPSPAPVWNCGGRTRPMLYRPLPHQSPAASRYRCGGTPGRSGHKLSGRGSREVAMMVLSSDGALLEEPGSEAERLSFTNFPFGSTSANVARCGISSSWITVQAAGLHVDSHCHQHVRTSPSLTHLRCRLKTCKQASYLSCYDISSRLKRDQRLELSGFCLQKPA